MAKEETKQSSGFSGSALGSVLWVLAAPFVLCMGLDMCGQVGQDLGLVEEQHYGRCVHPFTGEVVPCR